MHQVLIACCRSKRCGGVIEYRPSEVLCRRLKTDTHKYLLNCRKVIGSLLGLSPGHDLGFDDHHKTLEFMPAARRYKGNLYKAASLDTTQMDPELGYLTIISALYGLIDS